MANNLTSNVTRKLVRVFLDNFENTRVLSKAVNTQLLKGKFNPSSGSTVDFKRPHDYNTIETADGDISGSTKSDIIAGKATGTVQDYITVAAEWNDLEEAIELDQLDEIIAPMATRAVTKLETNFGAYMMKNVNGFYGSAGTAVDAWSDVAGAGAFLDSTGVPMDSCYYAMNPFTQKNLADAQRGLASGSPGLVNSAWEKAQISGDFGGMQALKCNTLASYTIPSGLSDLTGSLSANPTVTYVGAKDTMTQTLAVTGFSASQTVPAGAIVTITGRNRLNQATRTAIIDDTGSNILFSGVVTAAVTLDGSGAGNLVVAGAAIYEANGQYNTVDSAPVSGDVVTIQGAADTLYQPNLAFHKNAFGIGTVSLPKLYATDTIGTTEDGMSVRCTKYSDGDANTQKVRFDIVPAFATFNPFFGMQAFGV